MSGDLGVTVAAIVRIGLEVPMNICVKVDEGLGVASGASVATDVFVFFGNGARVSVERGVQVDVMIGVRVGGKI